MLVMCIERETPLLRTYTVLEKHTQANDHYVVHPCLELACGAVKIDWWENK